MHMLSPQERHAEDLRSPLNGARLFTESAERVVDYLKLNTPLSDWSVSRVANGEQVHVHVRPDQVLAVGDRVEWEESFCSRMSAGASHVVRNARADADYADLEAAEQVGAYAGFVIGDDRDGRFGILCGVRPTPLRDDEQVDEPLVRMLSELLTTQLVLARAIDRERRRVELTEALAHTDALTGVLNRRGWDGLVTDAQERLDAFGDPVAVGIVDLDGLKHVNDTAGHAAGDRLIARAADALRSACSAGSHVARYGGDEFAILVNGVSPGQVETAAAGFTRALDLAGVHASIGMAAAEPGIVPLDVALEVADRRMYAQKLARRAG